MASAWKSNRELHAATRPLVSRFGTASSIFVCSLFAKHFNPIAF